jgi:RyR domain
MSLTIEAIATVCHDANASYCAHVMNDDSQDPWEFAPDWQRESAIQGVRFMIDNPDSSSARVHLSWMSHKLLDGWVYGSKKDAMAKTHPCLVPYEELPVEQRRKDALFRAIVTALIN